MHGSAPQVEPEPVASAIERLLAVVQELAHAQDLSSVVEIVRRHARALVGADGVTFVLREGDLVYYAEEDAISPLWSGQRFPANACISGWAMLHREQVVIDDIYADTRVPHEAYRPTFVKSLVMTPVRRTDPVAAIGAYWAVKRFPTADELRLLQTLADSVAVALDRAQLFESERRARQAAEASNHMQRELLSIVSHDLRSPLSVITVNAQRIQRVDAQHGDDRSRRQVETILRTTSRMDRLIGQLLDFARIESGAFTVTPQPHRVSAILEHLNDLAAVAREKDLQLHVRSEAEDVLVDCELDRVVEVVSNLVTNAIKYSPASGRITVSWTLADRTVEFAITDTGEGVPEDVRAILFRRYSRAQKHRSEDGVGLGLSIAKGIVEAHGGRIWVDDPVPGEGATFRFTLKRAGLAEK